MAEVDLDSVTAVRNVLQAQFQDAEVSVDRFYGAERISGHIIWNGFQDMEQIDRQRAIHSVLREALGPNAQHVSIILAYTPDEYDSLSDD